MSASGALVTAARRVPSRQATFALVVPIWRDAHGGGTPATGDRVEFRQDGDDPVSMHRRARKATA
jgi:hypothetical protein